MGASSVTGTGVGSVDSFTTQGIVKTIANQPPFFTFTPGNNGQTLPDVVLNDTVFFFQPTANFTVFLPDPANSPGKTVLLFCNMITSSFYVTIMGIADEGSGVNMGAYDGIWITSDGNSWWWTGEN
jgi:hypothetical protein